MTKWRARLAGSRGLGGEIGKMVGLGSGKKGGEDAFDFAAVERELAVLDEWVRIVEEGDLEEGGDSEERGETVEQEDATVGEGGTSGRSEQAKKKKSRELDQEHDDNSNEPRKEHGQPGIEIGASGVK